MDRLDLLAVRGTLKSPLAPQFKTINSSSLSLLYGPTLTSIHDYWKNHTTKNEQHTPTLSRLNRRIYWENIKSTQYQCRRLETQVRKQTASRDPQQEVSCQGGSITSEGTPTIRISSLCSRSTSRADVSN